MNCLNGIIEGILKNENVKLPMLYPGALFLTVKSVHLTSNVMQWLFRQQSLSFLFVIFSVCEKVCFGVPWFVLCGWLGETFFRFLTSTEMRFFFCIVSPSPLRPSIMELAWKPTRYSKPWESAGL